MNSTGFNEILNVLDAVVGFPIGDEVPNLVQGVSKKFVT